MRAVAVIACRLESSRLFGKPMQRVGGKSILAHLIDRLKRVRSIDSIVLALSDAPGKAVFVDFAQTYGLQYVVGDEQDVLSRMILAAAAAEAEIVVRHTSDNPFPYWENLDHLIKIHRDSNADLTVTTGLPLGAYVEVISTSALIRSATEGCDRHRGEFCDLYIVENQDKFKIVRLEAPAQVREPGFRLTVDTSEDLTMMNKLYACAGDVIDLVYLENIVKVLRKNPQIARINDHVAGKHIWA